MIMIAHPWLNDKIVLSNDHVQCSHILLYTGNDLRVSKEGFVSIDGEVHHSKVILRSQIEELDSVGIVDTSGKLYQVLEFEITFVTEVANNSMATLIHGNQFTRELLEKADELENITMIFIMFSRWETDECFDKVSSLVYDVIND